MVVVVGFQADGPTLPESKHVTAQDEPGSGPAQDAAKNAGADSEPVSFDLPTNVEAASDAAVWQLYATSFPPEEREPEEVILASVANGAALLTRARTERTTCGFAVVHLLTHPPVAFLVYLAVSREHRGHGIGSRLFAYTWDQAMRVASTRGRELRGMIWEVDAPAQARTERERRRRLRRIEFFQRLGASALTTNYLQPPVNGPDPVSMMLMYRGTAGQPSPAARDLVHAIYFEKYGAANGVPTATLRRLLERIGEVY
jgi:GNAT superfamily N-acetyltransferase